MSAKRKADTGVVWDGSRARREGASCLQYCHSQAEQQHRATVRRVRSPEAHTPEGVPQGLQSSRSSLTARRKLFLKENKTLQRLSNTSTDSSTSASALRLCVCPSDRNILYLNERFNVSLLFERSGRLPVMDIDLMMNVSAVRA